MSEYTTPPRAGEFPSIADIRQRVSEAEAELAALDAEYENPFDPLKAVVDAKEAELRVAEADAAEAEKELAAVHQDYRNTEEFIAKFGDVDALEARLTKVEREAADGNLSHIWRVTLESDDLSRLDRAAVRADALHERIDDVVKTEEILSHRINELLVKCEQRKNLATLESDATLAEIEAAYKKELAALAETRKKLKVLEAEQAFHKRRGTYVKPPPAPRAKNLDHEREADVQTQTCAEIVRERDQEEALKEDVKDLEKRLATAQREAAEEARTLEAQIAELRAANDVVEWDRELLAVENEDLLSLKKEIIHVTNAAKQQRK